MLLNHLLMGTSANHGGRILSGFKLNGFKVWSLGAAGVAVPATVSVEWTSNLGPSTIVSDSSMSIAPAFVNTKPPKDSLASFWSLTGSNETEVLAILTYTTGSIVDMSYEAILQNGETPVVVVTTLAGVVGQVYMTPLSGIAVAGDLDPISYDSTL